ncbi:DedA family protein [Marinomonas rhizomae]|uniref:Membrane protein DedA with SNARE-associated domain n=1 Tax=Marinomonas rhizomae TaxID=491948 RepID=A0A366JFB9_9GAMM|nr:DedA family protein [Marinomonas rhizomae]RBP85643.1 membrane protein DedA with SNARE-associated domain [Marinomonas rhizomae]RNF75730.1 DedA family protein [Marinomonas rhizomae]
MIAELQAWLTAGTTSLALLCVGIVLLSYLLEDLAIATAATLSAHGDLSPSLALLSIFIGISTGDLGLYILGRYARKVRWLRYRALTNSSFKVVRRKLTLRAFVNLFLIRFIPGLRTIGFTLSGFLVIPLPVFFSAVLLATSIWTLVVFTLIYQIGSSVFMQVSELKWVLIPVAFGLLFLMNRFLNKSFTRGVS